MITLRRRGSESPRLQPIVSKQLDGVFHPRLPAVQTIHGAVFFTTPADALRMLRVDDKFSHTLLIPV
jgi:hypothetical protein